MTVEELKARASELGTTVRLLDEEYERGDKTDSTERLAARETYREFLRSIEEPHIRSQVDDAFWASFCLIEGEE